MFMARCRAQRAMKTLVTKFTARSCPAPCCAARRAAGFWEWRIFSSGGMERGLCCRVPDGPGPTPGPGQRARACPGPAAYAMAAPWSAVGSAGLPGPAKWGMGAVRSGSGPACARAGVRLLRGSAGAGLAGRHGRGHGGASGLPGVVGAVGGGLPVPVAPEVVPRVAAGPTGGGATAGAVAPARALKGEVSRQRPSSRINQRGHLHTSRRPYRGKICDWCGVTGLRHRRRGRTGPHHECRSLRPGRGTGRPPAVLAKNTDFRAVQHRPRRGLRRRRDRCASLQITSWWSPSR